jgi:DNA-3-methyladenine glycosylase I
VFDARELFAMLILEGAQSALSWLTILKKREHNRKVINQFDANKIARYTERKCASLLKDPGIVRNRLKVNATVVNAKCYLDILEEYESFSTYIWQFVDGKPIKNHWVSTKDVPVTTKQSDTMSKDLKKRGFKFVGSTICYAYMQAVGMVNDHTTDCFCYKK